jgi:hypothetical protein
MLTEMHEWLKSQGLLFERHGQRSVPESMLTAVMGWERLRKGGDVPFPVVKLIYKYLGTEFVKHGHKGLKTADVDRMYTHESLTKDHGLLTDAIWHEALTKIGEDKRNYLIALLRRGTRITGKATSRPSSRRSTTRTPMTSTDCSTSGSPALSSRCISYYLRIRTKAFVYENCSHV